MLVKRCSGFSVIELMVVVAIIGVLASIAMPSFRNTTATARVKTVASDIHLSLTRARSEAVKRNTNITVNAPSGWLGGWTVSSEDGTLETHGNIPGDVLVIAGPTSVTYTPNGRTTSNPVNISLTSLETSIARCVSVTLSGQPVVKQEACS